MSPIPNFRNTIRGFFTPFHKSACQTFQNQFSEVLSQVNSLSDIVQKYAEDPTVDPKDELQKGVDTVHKNYSELMETYKLKAREVLVKWFQTYFKNPMAQQYIDDISFEDSGRVTLSNVTFSVGSMDRYDQNEKPVTYFPTLIRKVARDVDIFTTHITNIDSLEEVGSKLTMRGRVTSAKTLRRVGGSLVNFGGYGEIAFESLEEVGRDFDNEPVITGLPKLKFVGGTFMSRNKLAFEELPELEQVEGALYLGPAPNFIKAPKLFKVGK